MWSTKYVCFVAIYGVCVAYWLLNCKAVTWFKKQNKKKKIFFLFLLLHCCEWCPLWYRCIRGVLPCGYNTKKHAWADRSTFLENYHESINLLFHLIKNSAKQSQKTVLYLVWIPGWFTPTSMYREYMMKTKFEKHAETISCVLLHNNILFMFGYCSIWERRWKI